MFKYIVIDTETTGLNIITDKPFLVQYGLVDEKLELIEAKLFDPIIDTAERSIFINHLKNIPTIIGSNIKFDIHMLINSGFDKSLIIKKNYIDTTVLARLVINHDEQMDNNARVGLKKLAVKYLGINSADEERILKAELSKLISEHKQKLKDYFISKNLWNLSLSKTNDTIELNRVYNSWYKYYHLYPHLVQEREKFFELYPAPTYADCTNVRSYALTDIYLTHGLLKLWYPKVVSLKQQYALCRTSKALIPLLETERKGMLLIANKFSLTVIVFLKEYLLVNYRSRDNSEINIGQHAKLKIYTNTNQV